MKTSCWHFTKNDCCFWSLYKNNRSVLIKSKKEAFFLSLNVASFFLFSMIQICLPVANKKETWILLRRKKKFSVRLCLVEKRYNTSAENNVLREGVWSKKDIILRWKKKMFSETVKKRYYASLEKKFFDVLLLPFAKQIVCFHLNVFSVVYCVYCCIVS